MDPRGGASGAEPGEVIPGGGWSRGRVDPRGGASGGRGLGWVDPRAVIREGGAGSGWTQGGSDSGREGPGLGGP